MANSHSRVASALNFLTGEGISYHPNGVKHTTLEALIKHYFNNRNDKTNDDSSSNESNNEGYYNCTI